MSAHLRDCTSRGETAGSFSSPPLLNFVASPLGTVPKKPDKLRLIHHLSAPEGLSVNDGITKEDFSLQYVKVDDAIARIMQLGRGTLLAKFDIRRAFRLCPVCPEDWHLLGMCWEGKYYYDKVFPFGLRSAPFIFNEVAEAFQWICAHHLSTEDMLHLLDDFLVLGPPKSIFCEQRITLALQMCHYLGFPIADEKTTWPSTELIFLGIILDTDKFESRLPDDKQKREDLLRLLEDMIERKHCTLKELQHLLGKPQFASRVVIPGWTFLRRLYDAAGHATQSFHRMRLSTACRLDLRWWKHFLQSWNGRSFFLEPWYTLASDLQVQTDAAASVGFGAICGGEWFHGLLVEPPIPLLHYVHGTISGRAGLLNMGPQVDGQAHQISHRQPGGGSLQHFRDMSLWNGTDFVSWPLKLGSHPRRSPAFHVFRGRPLFSRAPLCPASISASHQEGVHGWPGPFSQILLGTRSGAPASNRTNIGGVYRLFGRRGAMCTCHN